MNKDFKSTVYLGNNGKNDLHESCLERVTKKEGLIELGQIIEGLECQETFLCLFILFNKKVAVHSCKSCG